MMFRLSGFCLAKTIDELVSQSFSYKDFAVLYRTKARLLSKKLCSSQISLIPWLVEPSSTAVRNPIDIIAYLNLLPQFGDNISFERIINEPKRGIGPGTVEKIRDFAQYAKYVHARCFL